MKCCRSCCGKWSCVSFLRHSCQATKTKTKTKTKCPDGALAQARATENEVGLHLMWDMVLCLSMAITGERNLQQWMSGKIMLEVVVSDVTSQQSDASVKVKVPEQKMRANVAGDSGIWFTAQPSVFQLLARLGFIAHTLQCFDPGMLAHISGLRHTGGTDHLVAGGSGSMASSYVTIMSHCRSTPKHALGRAVCSSSYQLRKRDRTRT